MFSSSLYKNSVVKTHQDQAFLIRYFKIFFKISVKRILSHPHYVYNMDEKESHPYYIYNMDEKERMEVFK